MAVKSGAQYTGALGQKYFDLTKKLGEEILDDVKAKSGADVYKYISDASDKTMKYLLHKKFYDIQLDIEKDFDAMNFDGAFDGEFDFEAAIDFPALSKSMPAVVIPAGATDEIPFSFEIDASFDPCLVEAEIGDGEVVVQAQGSGAAFDVSEFSLDGITKSGGSSFDKSDLSDGGSSGNFLIDKVLPLSGAEIDVSASKIKVSGKISKISGDVALAAQLNCSISVRTISKAKANLSNMGGFEMNGSSANKKLFSADLLKNVGKITFGHSVGDYYYKSDINNVQTGTKGKGKGIKFSAVNSFPIGNDLELEINSSTFAMDSTDGTVYVDGEKSSAAVIPAKGNQSVFERSFADFDEIDFSDASVFGTPENPKYIEFSVSLSDAQELRNIEMGQSYTIKVSGAEFFMDWDIASLKLDNLESPSGDVDLSDFNLDELLDQVDGEAKKLIDNCEIKSVPVYVFVQKPQGDLSDLVDGISFEGKIFLEYNGGAKKYIAGSSSSSQEFDFCQAFNWPSTNETFVKKFESEGVDCSFSKDIADVINSRASDLKAHYEISASNGQSKNVSKARIDSMSSSETSSIAVEMALVLPLEFTVKSDTLLDIYELAQMDISDKNDLMNRSDVSSTQDYEKIADSIEYFRLNYNLINSALSSLDAEITIDDTHGGDSKYSGITKTIQFTADNPLDDTIDFDVDDIKKALTHLFLPDMTMTIESGQSFSVLRSALESKEALGINPVVLLKLNPNSPIDIKDIIK